MENKGANNLEVRRANIRLIFHLLYRNQAMTKQEIARALSLSLPTVSQILRELGERDLVQEAGMLASSGGRKPVLSTLNYQARLSVGVEITANHLRFVLCDLGGTVLRHQRLRQRFENTAAYFTNLRDLANAFIVQSGMQAGRVLGVGLAVPGTVNRAAGRIEFAPTLQVKNLPMAHIAQYFDCPVNMDNEANLAGFAESWGMEPLTDAVYLSLNKGVGGAILFNGKVHTGTLGRAGEFGHMTIVKDGRVCNCGKLGCLEAYCSTTVLTDGQETDLQSFFDAVAQGDAPSCARWQQYLRDLAVGIHNLRMVFDTDIILGGDIDEYLKNHMDQLQQYLQQCSAFDGAPRLHISRHGEKAGAVGAALLLVDEFIAGL